MRNGNGMIPSAPGAGSPCELERLILEIQDALRRRNLREATALALVIRERFPIEVTLN